MSRLVIYTERERYASRLEYRKSVSPNHRFCIGILNVWSTLGRWVEADPTIGEKVVVMNVRKLPRYLGKDTSNLVALTVKIEK